jgi:hypothetical protein
MMEVKKLRDLNMERSADESAAFVSAASGIAVVGSHVYIVADDRLCLASFNLADKTPGIWVRVFPGSLPSEHKARKKKKPDLEAICVLPASKFAKHGALLVVPSGSKEWRFNACLLPLDQSGKIAGEPLPLDFSNLFAHLRSKVNKLNIEGVCVSQEKLLLANRGASTGDGNAIISLDLSKFLFQAYDTHQIGSQCYLSANEFQLGRVKKVALGFTDLCALSDGRLVFSAAAECTDDAYEDGVCAGSAVGFIDEKFENVTVWLLDTSQKVEGVYAKPVRAIQKNGQRIETTELILVTDADSEASIASMLSTEITL